MRPLFAWLLLLALGGCSEASRADQPPVAAPPSAKASAERPVDHPSSGRYDVPQRSDREVARLLDRACVEGAERGRPWLIEVTAPWCGDCRALKVLETRATLAEELARWPRVQVNIGNFDRHAELREWLGVRAIAHWAVLEPNECSPALGRSPIVLQRTLEPSSGVPVTAESLASWLAEARASWRTP